MQNFPRNFDTKCAELNYLKSILICQYHTVGILIWVSCLTGDYHKQEVIDYFFKMRTLSSYEVSPVSCEELSVSEFQFQSQAQKKLTHSFFSEFKTFQLLTKGGYISLKYL